MYLLQHQLVQDAPLQTNEIMNDELFESLFPRVTPRDRCIDFDKNPGWISVVLYWSRKIFQLSPHARFVTLTPSRSFYNSVQMIGIYDHRVNQNIEYFRRRLQKALIHTCPECGKPKTSSSIRCSECTP